MNNLEIYKEKINKSEIFKMQKGTTEYSVARDRLLNNAYNYYTIFNASAYQDCGLELIIAVDNCLGSYKPEAGDFLNYLSISLKKEMNKAKAIEARCSYTHGMSMSDERAKFVSEIAKARHKLYGEDGEATVEEVSLYLANSLDMDYDKVLRDVMAFEGVKFQDTVKNEDDEELSLLDITPGYESAEDTYMEEASILNILSKIEEEYKRTRSNKELISVFLTTSLYSVYPDGVIPEKIKNLEFFNQKIHERFLKEPIPLKKKEIAELFNISPTSLSRTISNFLSRITTEIK